MESTTTVRWAPITDLPADWETLAKTELRALGEVWSQQKQRLEASGDLALFTEKLAREFAIETGILERLYTLDRGITLLLIEQGIDAARIPRDATDRDPQLVAAMIRDQHEAAEALFDFVKQRRRLSTGSIKELHALLTRHQPTTTALTPEGHLIQVGLLRGDWKRRSNNPQRANGTVHEYCPPEQVASEMDRLVELHREHEDLAVPPEVEAAWLHHRFTQIHAFEDGNGRVARCVTSLIFLKAGWFPLVIDRDQRTPYIAALETADQGDLSALIEVLASAEKRALIRALSLVRQTQQAAQVSQVISAVRRDMEQRLQQIRQGWEKVKGTAEEIRAEARRRLEKVDRQLEAEIRPLRSTFEFFIDEEGPDGDRRHWFRHQVVETAKHLQYFANTDEFHSWARLVLRTDQQSEILLSLHGLGKDYTGLMAVSCCFFRRGAGEEGASQVVDLLPLSDEVFQVNYVESERESLDRFPGWFDACLVRGLEHWRKGL
jgi:Fic family protein